MAHNASRRIVLLLAAFAVSLSALAQIQASKQIEKGGSGPYKAIIVQDEKLPDFTIYRPLDLAKASKKEGRLPVIVYGNGGCRNTSVEHEKFLNEIASHGYVVVAIGPYLETSDPQAAWKVGGSTDASQLSVAIDWVLKDSQARGSEYRKRLNTKKIAAMGQSCGGTQALTAAAKDKRVRTGVILNSGLFGGDAKPFGGGMPDFAAMFQGGAPEGMEMPDFAKMFQGGNNPFAGGGLSGMGGSISKEELSQISVPLVYIIGGESDIAYSNAEDDYARLTVPVAKCNLPVGHLGTYNKAFGGEFAVIALKWLDWQLKGKKAESSFFLDADYAAGNYPEWSVEHKNF